MWGLDYFPDDEPKFNCAVCGIAIFEDTGVCSNVCFELEKFRTNE